MGIFGSLFQQQLIGLDIGVSGIKAVELEGKKTPRLLAYNRLPLPFGVITAEGEIKESSVIVTALKKLFERGFSTKQVAVGATGNAIITKKITVPRMSQDELSHQLYWEAEQYIPFNINDVNLDFAILGNSNSTGNGGQAMIDVLLVAAKKDYIQTLMSVVEKSGLDPIVVDSQAFALGNSFELNYAHLVNKQGPTNVILDLGAGSTKLSVVDKDKTIFTRELRFSGIMCTQMISEKLNISIQDAEVAKITKAETMPVKEIVVEFTHLLVEEVSRTIDFFASQTPDKALSGLYLCGGVSLTPGLKELFASRLSFPVNPLNCVQNIAGSGKKMSAQAIREVSYLGAVAIGLALRAGGDS